MCGSDPKQPWDVPGSKSVSEKSSQERPSSVGVGPLRRSLFFSVMCPCTILRTLERQISQITWLFWGFHRHKKVSQGLPGACAPDQLRNELTWKKQGQTPSSFHLFKVARSSCQLRGNVHWIGRGFQDHFDPMLSSSLCKESTKSVTPVLPQLRTGDRWQSHGFWKAEPDSHY